MTLETHRRAVLSALGTTPLDTYRRHLSFEPQSERTTLGPREARVRIRAAAVGWVDLLMASGQYQHVPEPPYTPGLEFAGEVAAIGDAVQGLAVGTRVIADGLLTGPRSLGDHRAEGGFATFATAPADALIPLPTGFSFEEGACLLGSTETAYHALVHRGRVAEGEVVLVLGASGSTGLATVQLAKELGAKVLAAGRTAEKLEAAREAGADALIVLGDERPSLKEQVRSLTGGRGADVVYDPVGGPLSVDAMRAAAFGARFLVVGWAATPFVAREGRDPNVLPTNLILMKSLDVLGSPAAIAVHRDPSLRQERLARILAWANAGRLRPHISATFPLDRLVEALEAKWEGRHPGNLVITP